MNTPQNRPVLHQAPGSHATYPSSPSQNTRERGAEPSASMPIALGWRDIVNGQHLLATCTSPLPPPHHINAPFFSHNTEPAHHLQLDISSDRTPLIDTVLGLHPASAPSLLAVITKTQRQAHGWGLVVRLISPRYRILQASTLDAMWPDGHRNQTDVIDFQPADLPPGQRALLIKATRTSSLALCMPWTIHLEGRRWVRASRPVQKGHLVAACWAPAHPAPDQRNPASR